ncbi:TIGR02647 family protein [Methylophaga sp.]|uniref:TIGR02647 family protein n=1 Tax=Methylophaga sp. TaxID=2024840 RepID=UPI003F696F06
MTIKQKLIDEIEVLLQFPLDSTQAGIKIHNSAKEELISAAQILFEKGLITQHDGGYLTDLGYEAAEHLQHALRIITS